MKKQLKIVAVTLGAAAGLFGAAYYLLFRRPLPKHSGKIQVNGLTSSVEILRDQWGVPHIYAPNEQDVYFAQGYIHAEERLWQMEFNRRLVAGRVSELLGEPAINLDRWMRTLGMRNVATQEVELLDAQTRSTLEAYAAGVNARIQRGRLPLEFNLLRFKPEPWTIVDSIAWSKMMAWNLSVNWESEILRSMLIEKLGQEKAAELEPGYFEQWPLIFPPNVSYSKIGVSALDRSANAKKLSGPGATSGVGSNNWVISGKRTATGKPLLANDMHLGLTIPAIWFENHLSSGEMDITGVSFPGVPGIISGHNNFIAWGFTNGFPDVQDLYMEHLRKDSNDAWQYEYDGKWINASVRQEKIIVRGKPPVVEEVIATQHGPIINNMWVGEKPEQPLALRWTAYEPSRMMKALYDMNRAQSCEQLHAALRNWVVPVQNVVYADISGNIGYTYPGKIPLRRNGDGRLPVPGWISDYEWEGYIPFDELPHQFNPENGFIATANNRVVGEDYKYWLGYDFVTGNRAQRIVEMITATPAIDSAYIEKMHIDWVSTAAVEVNKFLKTILTDDPEINNVLEKMRAWDGSLAIDSSAASVYQVFCLKMLELMLTPKLGPDLTARYMGKGPTPVLAEGSIFAERSREFLQVQLQKASSPWFDLGNGENRDDLAKLALRQSIDFLKDSLGPSFENWGWGKIHTVTFPHVLGAVPALKPLFSRGPYPIGGDADTIWNTQSTRYNLAQEVLVGPPFRMIVDLGNLAASKSQLTPGQSGHPTSPHYADNINDWMSGKYHPVLFRFADVKDHAEARLTLLPLEE